MAFADRGASIYDAESVQAVRRALRLDPQQLRRLRNAVMKKFLPDEQVRAAFPAAQRLQLHALSLDRRLDSQIDGATKLLFRTDAGLLTESVVLRIASGRSTVCVSSQVGCAAACRFCATGTMGIARSLSTAEILDQVASAGQIVAAENRRLRNVVFMGMGEPLHNEEALLETLAALTHPAWFDLSARHIMVSSVGIIDGMLRLAERFPRVGMALSLHSARQDTRQSLIPLAKKYPLPQLREAIVRLNAMQSHPVMLEYVMLAGRTDTEDERRALEEWSTGLDVHINLIPYNLVDGAPKLQPTPMPEIRRFAERLKASGLKTTVRRSLGRDIEAACGQLVERHNLARSRATVS